MPARNRASATRSMHALAGSAAPGDGPGWTAHLTSAGFVIAIAITIARLLMLEVARESTDVAPGIAAAPRGPGAATGLLLDLLACVPALLVLARASLDNGFKLRRSIGFARRRAGGVVIGLSG